MTFDDRVRAVEDSLNETDDALLLYIRENREEILNLTIQKMSQKLFIAPNSIMRFAKKLGYSGFAELKFSIQSELHPREETTGRQLMDMLPKTVVRTLDIIDQNQLKIAAELIHQAGSCILAGVGDSNIYCELLGKNLRCVDCNVQYYTQIHDMIYAVDHASARDLLIVISARGENKRLVDLAANAKRKVL